MAASASHAPLPVSDPGNYDIPWSIGLPSDGDELERGVITSNHVLVAHPIPSDLPIELEDAYMRRITACVNACAGLRDEELEAFRPGDLALLVYEDRAQRARILGGQR